MSISARNQLKVSITDVKQGAVNSLVSAKLSSGAILKATVTVDSQEALGLTAGKDAVFLFKASSVILAKSSDLKLSATNQIDGKISKIKDGVVNAEIIVDVNGDEISSIITKSSLEQMGLKVGDSVTAIIKATQIIVGVKN